MGDAIAARGCLEVDELLALVEPACPAALRRTALAHASGCEACRLAIAGVARAIATDSASTDRDPHGAIDDAVPDRIDRYVVVREVGRGSMGVVYEAEDPVLGRRVAIKRLHPSVAAPDLPRLRREARALARLAHPNVVAVLEAGADWFAMELVVGESLAVWQRDRPWREVVQAYLDAAQGLAAAHALGIVHRDFKPHNALVTRGDDARVRVRVVDFGLAAATSTTVPSDGGMIVTRSGFVGTPAYMSPEQFLGERADAASDQFSFCVALFEALAGRRPFAGHDLSSLRANVLAGDRVVPARAEVPVALWRVLARGTSVQPGRRWPTMLALVDAIEAAVRPRRRMRWLAVAAVAVVPMIASAEFERTPEACRDAARIDEVWGDPQARAVQAAVLDTGLPYAATTAARVVEQLDAWVADWVVVHDEVCRATRTNAAALACLDDRKAALGELTGVIASGDASLTGGMVQAVERLELPRVCLDRANVPFPSGPRAREISREVAQMRATISLGHVDIDTTGLEAMRDEADAIGDPRLAAEVRLLLGTVLARRPQWPEAMPVLEDAYLRAYELGEDGMASDAAHNLALGASWQGRPDEALRWANLALAVAPSPARRTANASAASQALIAMGRVDEAEAVLAEALAPGAPPDARAAALTTMATIRGRAGHPEAGVPMLREAIGIVEAHAGPSHPDVVAPINALGIAQIQTGQLRAAVVTLEQARALAVSNYGEHHPFVGHVLGNLGLAQSDLGDYDASYRTLVTTLEIFEDAGGVEDPRTAMALRNLAKVALDAGRPADALRYALVGLQRGRPSDDDGGARLWSFVARARRHLGDYAGSLAAWDTSLSVWRTRAGDDTLGWLALEAARTAMLLGDEQRAEKYVARALDHYARSTETSPHERARADLVAARVRAGDRGRAVGHLRRAAGLLREEAVPDSARWMDLVATWVGGGGEAAVAWSSLVGEE